MVTFLFNRIEYNTVHENNMVNTIQYMKTTWKILMQDYFLWHLNKWKLELVIIWFKNKPATLIVHEHMSLLYKSKWEEQNGKKQFPKHWQNFYCHYWNMGRSFFGCWFKCNSAKSAPTATMLLEVPSPTSFIIFKK